jgi:hypothetical protein
MNIDDEVVKILFYEKIVSLNVGFFVLLALDFEHNKLDERAREHEWKNLINTRENQLLLQ